MNYILIFELDELFPSKYMSFLLISKKINNNKKKERILTERKNNTKKTNLINILFNLRSECQDRLLYFLSKEMNDWFAGKSQFIKF